MDILELPQLKNLHLQLSLVPNKQKISKDPLTTSNSLAIISWLAPHQIILIGTI